MSISGLARRFSRKVDQGKGLQLSPVEVDILVACGAYAQLIEFSLEDQKQKCLDRCQSTKEASSVSKPVKVATTTSSGMTSQPDSIAASARAAKMFASPVTS